MHILSYSGESGSGKTETANFAMQYLGAIGGVNDRIELQLIQTSHVLEAFGNAKTSLNDNSSRFVSLFHLIQFPFMQPYIAYKTVP